MLRLISKHFTASHVSTSFSKQRKKNLSAFENLVTRTYLLKKSAVHVFELKGNQNIRNTDHKFLISKNTHCKKEEKMWYRKRSRPYHKNFNGKNIENEWIPENSIYCRQPLFLKKFLIITSISILKPWIILKIAKRPYIKYVQTKSPILDPHLYAVQQ